MPRVPYPSGFEGVENLPKSRQSLTNCFNNGEGAIISRPGIEQTGTTPGVSRGQFIWRGSVFFVVNEELMRIDNLETGETTVIGTIQGNAFIDTAIGFTNAVIVVKGGNIYALDVNDALSDLSGEPNYEPSDAVTFINDRFVFIPSNGQNPAFFTNAASLTVQAANFFDAQELPDQNTTAFNLRNTLYIAGTDSFELFRDTGVTPVPFSRLNGARLDFGFIGGLVEYADTVAFIGRERHLDQGIYLVSQGTAEKISNEAIDLILSRYTVDQLSNAVANRFKWRGYDVVTFSLPNDSFAFCRGNWWFLSVLVDGDQQRWGAGFINQIDGTYYSSGSGVIGKLSEIDTEYGLKIPRIIDIAVQQEDNEWFACQGLSMQISQGYSVGGGTVGIAVSRNNVEYGEYLFRDLGDIGDYSDHLDWSGYPGGLGAYDGFMGIRIYTTQSVEFNSNGLYAFFRN